jgi:predicted nucleotidyltransferase
MMFETIRRPRLADDIALGMQLAKMQGRPIGPGEVARVLENAGVKYVIVGAHAANGYSGKPRATVDVDVIAQFPKKAAAAIAKAFPHLTIEDSVVVTRFKDESLEAIDIMKPAVAKLWPRLLKDAREIRIAGEMLRVPSLEGVIAAKFASMVSPTRRLPDKKQDAVDFIRIVEANERIDLNLLKEYAELVYPGGGEEVLKLVADARAGKRLEF